MHPPDGVIRAVKTRPEQVVHPRVHHHEVLDGGLLGVEHPGHQDPRIPDQHAPRLQHHRGIQVPDHPDQRPGELLRQRRSLVVVGDPQAAADVDVADVRPLLTQPSDQGRGPRERVHEGLDLGDLRPDVLVDPHHLQGRQLLGGFVLLQGATDVDPELALLQAGRDVRVSLRVHVRVDPQCHARLPSQLRCHLVDATQFLVRLHVEHEYVGHERVRDLLASLPYAGVHNPLRRHARRQPAEQFAARDHIQAAPQTREELQDGQVRVGLQGEADQVRDRGECLIQDPEVPCQCRMAIDVGGRANLFGDAGDRDILTIEIVAPMLKEMHPRPPFPENLAEMSHPVGAASGGMGTIRHRGCQNEKTPAHLPGIRTPSRTRPP